MTQSPLPPSMVCGVYIFTYTPSAKAGKIPRPNVIGVGTYVPCQRKVPQNQMPKGMDVTLLEGSNEELGTKTQYTTLYNKSYVDSTTQ